MIPQLTEREEMKKKKKTHNPNSELFLAVIDLLSSVKIELSSCNKPFKSTGC